MSKTFTIFGVTGQQGGALVRYLLRNPAFSAIYRLRGVTRDASKPAAVELRKRGVDIVEANLDKPDTLRVAVRGSYAVFAVTNYWETAQAAVEVAQGKALADAAVEEKVEFFIWSSLPPIGIPHFDSKAEVERYIRTLPLTSVFFMPGWFMQNFQSVTKPRKITDEKYVLDPIIPSATASTRVPLIDIEDIGKYLAPALQDPPRYNHTRLFAATAFYTLARICRVWTECTNTEVVFEGADHAKKSTEAQEEGLSEDLGSGNLSYYGAEGEQGVEWTIRQVQEKLTTWEDFVKDHEPWFS
ncbi:NmrA family transcriptional regulator [Eremomyces bilateralis CBS 781.70]|uniref:NmrA family transcriptional regulator n=1 Tax=Eremomyces bilateralis CBS 781.70 TaxID=1392243 RepID=A0A6G1GBR5_9PEZI|nr:NmrA family transcriptional regulator [Eremomyces bilateralis CBS 781.70]KAF1815340.1 NmrA family transcriptional regulator [Eremomyces bilateralis CBS 781.70]